VLDLNEAVIANKKLALAFSTVIIGYLNLIIAQGTV